MARIRKLSDLRGRRLHARDGEIGRLEAVLFDDVRWTVRQLVVRSGGWLAGRDVLISPRLVTAIDDGRAALEVDLTRGRVEACPPLAAGTPVSRRIERMLHRHYGLEPWWAGTSRRALEDARLHDSEELIGHHIRATDGSVGHVVDLLISDDDFRVRYLEVDTRRLLPGRHVLVAPAWIEGVSFRDREVRVTVGREAVKSAPPYDPDEEIGPDDEIALFEHYGLAARESGSLDGDDSGR